MLSGNGSFQASPNKLLFAAETTTESHTGYDYGVSEAMGVAAGDT